MSAQLFKRLFEAFLFSLVIFSSVVLLTVYIFQFPSVGESWANHSWEELTIDVGLKRESKVDVFLKLLSPLLILFSSALYLKFFRSVFLRVMIPRAKGGWRLAGRLCSKNSIPLFLSQILLGLDCASFANYSGAWRSCTFSSLSVS